MDDIDSETFWELNAFLKKCIPDDMNKSKKKRKVVDEGGGSKGKKQKKEDSR